MEIISLLIGIAIGLVIGGLVVWVILRSKPASDSNLRVEVARLEGELRAEKENSASLDAIQERMKEAFTSLAHQALTSNSEQLLSRSRDQLESLLKQVRGDWGTQKEQMKGLVDPLSKALDAIEKMNREMEQSRKGAYGELTQQLRAVGEGQSQLQLTTRSLEQAMKSPTARGKWGELQLRRVVELAGMQNHVDFEEQVSAESGIPDMTIRLPNKGSLPVDSKAAASAYLDAMGLDGSARTAKLKEHAQAVKDRIKDLAKKEYWNQFEQAPEIVVMFIPFEAALSAAFDSDPTLLEFGIERRVLVASPITLLALLKATAFGWQQFEVAERAREIADHGRELYTRFLNVLKPIADTGERLGRAVDAYNQAISSVESRLKPQLRRLQEMTVSPAELPSLSPIDQKPRLPLDME